MTAPNIASRVRAVIAEHAVVSLDVCTDDRRLGELDLDSLDQILVVMDLEEEFAISVGGRLTKRWETVGDVVRTVEMLAGPAEPVVAFAGPVSRVLP